MSRHSTGESSLDRRVLSRPFCSHLTVLSPQDCSVITSRDESSLDRRVFSRSRLARSLAATHSLSRSRSHNKTISQHVGAQIVLSDAYARARPCLSDKRTSTRTH
ncbi:hypothetical protein YC2023_108008 [Brassica napus]